MDAVSAELFVVRHEFIHGDAFQIAPTTELQSRFYIWSSQVRAIYNVPKIAMFILDAEASISWYTKFRERGKREN